jgi:hypothetical protein
MAPILNAGRAKARIQANKSIAYPTDPSDRAVYKTSSSLSSDEWSTLGASGSKISAFQWKVYDLVKQVSLASGPMFASIRVQAHTAQGDGGHAD